MKVDALPIEKLPVSTRLMATLNSLQSLIVALLVLNAFTVFAGLWMGKLFWMFDLLSHFQVQHLCVSVLCSVIFLCFRNWQMFTFSGCVSVVILYQLAPYWLNTTHHSISQPTLRVVSINLLLTNRDFGKVETFLKTTDADVVCVQEFTPDWMPMVRRLSIYPHTIIEARTDGFGIAILSKVPFSKQNIFSVGGVPWISATIEQEEQPVDIIAVHTLPPVGARYTEIRNQQLRTLSEVVQSSKSQVIVAGDFNCTPWSLYFKELIADTNLTDTRLGYGLSPSWPIRLAARIPIDHVLTSTGFQVNACTVGQETGSDHLPVICDLSLATNPKK